MIKLHIFGLLPILSLNGEHKEEALGKGSMTPLLDTVQLPADLRDLEESQLSQLADELRAETIEAVAAQNIN